LPDNKVVVCCTGSQGEPTSALARMANGDHRWVQIKSGDTVILSASPIPGNEGYVYAVVNNLFKLGAHVLYNRIDNIHVRGHAAQEELKLIQTLVRPQYFVPIHGEFRHLSVHVKLAQEMGMPAANTFVMEDGDVLTINQRGARRGERVAAKPIYVDGLGVGDVDGVVLRDRQHLANDGMVIIVVAVDKVTARVTSQPDVISRGFVDTEEETWLIDRAREIAAEALNRTAEHPADLPAITNRLKDTIAKFLYDETRRRPMVLPVTVEV
jgi:ribonuclease J